MHFFFVCETHKEQIIIALYYPGSLVSPRCRSLNNKIISALWWEELAVSGDRWKAH